jgi:hypothetical protein
VGAVVDELRINETRNDILLVQFDEFFEDQSGAVVVGFPKEPKAELFELGKKGFAGLRWGRFSGHAGGRARPCCFEMIERAAGEYPADSSSINVSLGEGKSL